jgi:cell division protein FtsL
MNKILFVTMLNSAILVAIIVLSLAIHAFPKDKETPAKPQLTDAQKVELLKVEVAILNLAIAIQPEQLHIQQLSQEHTALLAKASAGVDPTKWRLNPATMEFDAVPPKAEEKKPETPKPAQENQ